MQAALRDAATCLETLSGSTSAPAPTGSTSVRQLLHLADHVLDQFRGRAAEYAAETTRRSGSAAAQQREAKADDTEASEQRAHPRQENPAAKHLTLLRGRVAPFLRMQRIHEHEPCDLCGMRAGERPDDECAERMSDEHVRRRDAGVAEQAAQLVDKRGDRTRAGGAFAPCQSGPVVAAHACRLCHAGLDPAPCQGGCGDACFENDGRPARAQAHDSAVGDLQPNRARQAARTFACHAPPRWPGRAGRPPRAP